MKTISISEKAFHFLSLLTSGHYFPAKSRRVLEHEFVNSLDGVKAQEVVPTPAPYTTPMTKEMVIYTMREHLSACKGNRNFSTKLPMIKFLRCITGWGLKDAKDFVELHGLYEF